MDKKYLLYLALLIAFILLISGCTIKTIATGAGIQCSDYDGKNFYKWGYVVGIDDLGNYFEFEDTCIGNQVKEYFCTNNDLETVLFNCPNGCEKGRCLQVEDPCDDKECKDNDACTLDSCSAGLCVFTPKQCPSGQYCDNGECRSFAECRTDADCDDDNDDTIDKCIDDKCSNMMKKDEPVSFFQTYGILMIIALMLLIIAGYFIFVGNKKSNKSKKR